jgi:deoxyhypusine synthase
MSLSDFMHRHYRHFNAAEVLRAAQAWKSFWQSGGKMLVTLAGAMSTAELGISLARLIRAGAVQAICSTGANLEEDLFRLVCGNAYHDLPGYRQLSERDEARLAGQNLHRVTDTCIPYSAMQVVEDQMLDQWKAAAAAGHAFFPDEYAARLVERWRLSGHDSDALERSWLAAAAAMGVPIFTPGWEDSSLGCAFAAQVIEGLNSSVVKMGVAQTLRLVDWYRAADSHSSVGMFQIGGGIAGDFAVSVVPLILHDLGQQCRRWQYFAQISDSTTSYGSYSGAPPAEKISWSKIDPHTPTFMIESDATIVAPLIFGYVLGL